jgi:4'-phosphopantetheinyl transferase EntD
MASDFPGIIEELKRSEASVFGASLPEWGAEIQGHREKIRTALKTALLEAGEAEHESLTDLKRPPRPAKFSVSISHTQGFGAWIACARPHRIGLDIENRARIKREIVERVSTAFELSAAPHFEYLWCAKEAYYKAMESDQPSTISELEISNWKKTNGLFTFAGGKAFPVEGFVLEFAPYILAIALNRSVSS